MNKVEILSDLQYLLYVWLSKFEKRSLTNIKAHCNFLNDSYKLNISYPDWSIFWPLVYNGLVDHVGKGYYAVTTPIIIDYGSHFIYVNHSCPEKFYHSVSCLGPSPSGTLVVRSV